MYFNKKPKHKQSSFSGHTPVTQFLKNSQSIQSNQGNQSKEIKETKKIEDTYLNVDLSIDTVKEHLLQDIASLETGYFYLDGDNSPSRYLQKNIPSLFIDYNVYIRLQYIIKYMADVVGECGGFLITRKLNKMFPQYVAMDYFIPMQDAASASVDIDAKWLVEYTKKLKDTLNIYTTQLLDHGLQNTKDAQAEKSVLDLTDLKEYGTLLSLWTLNKSMDPNVFDLLTHWHSHGKMGTFWSGTDTKQQEDPAQNGFMADNAIFLVFNLKEVKGCYRQYKPVFLPILDNIHIGIKIPKTVIPLASAEKKKIQDIIAKNISVRKYQYTPITTPSSYYYGGYYTDMLDDEPEYGTAKPGFTFSKPDTTINKPEITNYKPDTTSYKPDTPINKQSVMSSKPNTPMNKPSFMEPDPADEIYVIETLDDLFAMPSNGTLNVKTIAENTSQKYIDSLLDEFRDYPMILSLLENVIDTLNFYQMSENDELSKYHDIIAVLCLAVIINYIEQNITTKDLNSKKQVDAWAVNIEEKGDILFDISDNIMDILTSTPITEVINYMMISSPLSIITKLYKYFENVNKPLPSDELADILEKIYTFKYSNEELLRMGITVEDLLAGLIAGMIACLKEAEVVFTDQVEELFPTRI